LIKYFDIDGDGNISYDEFLSGLRDPLSARKQAMVDRAFALLDKTGSGEIQVKDITKIYDTSKNPEVIEGKKTHDEVLKEFLNSFEGLKGNHDGVITKSEWDRYYTDLGVSVPSDEYFVGMMESVWAISEDDSSQLYEDEIRRLIGLIR
jgi:calcyphosin